MRSSYWKQLASTYDHCELVQAVVVTWGISLNKAAFFTSKSMRDALVMGSPRLLKVRGW